MGARVSVVGIGADGWDGLAPGARSVVLGAEVLLGGRRHLALVPSSAAVREPWPSPLLAGLPALLERYDGQQVVVLASGDPLVSGIGSTLVDLLGPDAVEVHPAVSSVALARARMGWPSDSCDVVTLVGRDPDALRRWLSPRRRLVVLASDGSTASVVAAILAAPETVVRAPVAGLPDAAFEHDGQLSKRDLRALALSRLGPTPGELLWDVGAGAGSVGIEWMRTDPRCRAIAVESSVERAERIARNASRLGVPALDVRTGSAPSALSDLPAPDAVFVGGGATVPGVLETCWERLGPGGRLVVHAVTLETEAVVTSWRSRVGGELVRVSVEHAEPLGSFTGWRPARPVVQWAVTR
jgi:precorrin-6Y C5,15-methyltransferase (decarboxylating)